MPASRRPEQLGQLIRDELSDLMRRSMGDPRLRGVVSITRVELTPDLRQARIHVSALGGAEERNRAVAALTSASGYLRRELASRLRIRYTPQLTFIPDDSLEHGTHMMELLKQVQAELPKAEQQPEGGEPTTTPDSDSQPSR